MEELIFGICKDIDTKVITGTKRLTFGDKSIHRLWRTSKEDILLDGAYICYVNEDNTYAVDIIAMEYRQYVTGRYILFIPIYEQFEHLRELPEFFNINDSIDFQERLYDYFDFKHYDMTKYTRSVPPYIKYKIPPASRREIKDILEYYGLKHYNEFDIIKHGGFDVSNTSCKTRSTYNKHLFPERGHYLKDYTDIRPTLDLEWHNKNNIT